MKKNIVLSIVFFSILFSSVHSFAFEFFNDEKNCVITSKQFATEFNTSSVDIEVCEKHHKCHHSYVLNQNDYISKFEFRNINETLKATNYIFQFYTFLLKPPII